MSTRARDLIARVRSSPDPELFACATETGDACSLVAVKRKPVPAFWKAIRKVGPTTPTGVIQTWSMPIPALEQLTSKSREMILQQVEKGAPRWFPWRDIHVDADKTTVLFAIPVIAYDVCSGETSASMTTASITVTGP